MVSAVPSTEDDWVLVTGGNGHLGSHLVRRLLHDGHRVRATVRSQDAEARLRAAVDGVDGRLDVVGLDLSTEHGWASAMAGCAYVHHVASPLPVSAPVHEDEVIRPARDGTLRVLRAARDARVARVVLTSSFVAVGYSRKPGDEYDETDWTDPTDDDTAYTRSKVVAERAAWDFVGAESGMELAVVAPTGIFGPLLTPHLCASTALVKTMLDGAMPAVPRMYFGVVDVRDVADLHVRAMRHPAAAGERFLANSGDTISFLRFAEILREHLGAAAVKAPKQELTDEQVRTIPDLRETVKHLGVIPVVHTEKARTVLGWTPRDPVEAIIATADSVIRLGLVAT
jgi:nucleoside-diphosphate-sugar epimerase